MQCSPLGKHILRRAALAATALILATGRPASAAEIDLIEERIVDGLLDSVASASTVNGYQSSMASNGSWSDVDYGSTADVSWEPLAHLDRLLAMSEAYSSASHALYHNAGLKTSLLRAYSYWISKDPRSSNFFYNEIETPQRLGDAMVLIKDLLTGSQKSAGLDILERAYQPRSNNSGTNTGQNRVDRAIAGIRRGIVAGSNSITADAFAAAGDAVQITTGSGIQRDNSFHQHGAQLYNQGYGSDFLSSTLKIAALGNGTSFGFSSTQKHVLVDYALDGTQWMVRGQVIDYTAGGRNITRKGHSTSAEGLSGPMATAISISPDYRTDELKAFRARQLASNDSGSADHSLSLTGNRHYWRSDFSVQQRPAYYSSVKISSTRTIQPEMGNEEGLKSLYLGDGVNLLMRTGNEYDSIMPVWNWRRLPGTTVEQDSRSLKQSAEFGVKGTSTFAGGVSDGLYGATAFRYDRYNVAAKKSWFNFDKEYVALGAAINAEDSTSNVNTTLNQTLLKGTVSYKTTASATVRTVSLGSTVTPSDLQWVFHDGVGYFFLSPVDNATIRAVTQTGTWEAINARYDDTNVSKDVFTLYLNHGNGFTGGSYNYIVVPGMTVAKMDGYLAASPIDILRNTSTVQAIRQSSLDITQAAFYSAASLTIASGQSLSVDAPSAVMLRRPQNALQLTASSPEAKAMSLKIGLSGVDFSAGGSGWLDGFGQSASVTVGLPGGDLAGSSVGFNIATNADATPVISFRTTGEPASAAYASSAAIALPANTSFAPDGGIKATFDGVISGGASLTKTDGGTLNLNGKNTYTGGTTVTDGDLNVSGNQTAADGGWAVGPSNAHDVTVKFLAGSSVRVGAGKKVQIGDVGPTGTAPQLLVAAGTATNLGTLAVGRNATLQVDGDWTQDGDMAISGRGDKQFSAVLAVNGGATFTYTGTSTVKINPAPVGSGNASLVLGNTDGQGIFTTSRGFEQTVTGGGGGTSIITLQNNGKIVFTADVPRITTGDFQFNIGAVGGVIDTKNFDAGLHAPIKNLSGATGGLTKRGDGTLELFAASTYQGQTTIGNGTLKVSNTTGSATGTGGIVIESGATLLGRGKIGGSVVVEQGGTISPGSSSGTLTTGAQTWSSGGIYHFDISKVDPTQASQAALKGTDAGADWISMTGALNVTATPASRFILGIHGLGGAADGQVTAWDKARNYTWTLATTTSSIAGFSADKFDIDADPLKSNNAAPGAWSVSLSGKDLLLNYRVSTIAMTIAATSPPPAGPAVGAVPQLIDVLDSNSGNLGFSTPTATAGDSLFVAVDVDGVSNLSAFIGHLQAATGSRDVTVTNIAGAVPLWVSQAGGGTDWDILLRFDGRSGDHHFAWDFAQDAGVSVDRFAILAQVPEPTGATAIAVGAGLLLLRRRSR